MIFTKLHTNGVGMYAENLKKIRKELDISALKLADKLESSANTISSYERGIRCPSMDFGTQLYEKLNINLNWFVSGEGLMFRNECENTHILVKNEKPIENFKNWGKRLSKILAENEETPYNFAKRTGIKESRLESFMLNSAEPTITEINAIKANVDVSIDELLYGETVQKNTQTENISLSVDEILKLKKILNQSKF